MALRRCVVCLYRDAVLKLMDAIDAYVPDPVRALDKPFAMPVEDVFSIQVCKLFHHFL